MARPLYEIAAEIRKTWKDISPRADVYLRDMETLNTICDYNYLPVFYFLSNASVWRGEDARRIKYELKQMIGLI
jgi:hypothetical protein